MPHLLLVDDDKDLSFVIKEWLLAENYSLDISHNGLEGYEYLRQGTYDVIILDWDMPGMSGVEVLQKYRASGGQAPVLMLTAKSQISDKEAGLDAGSDDYLCKPFHMRELSARLRALSRRQGGKHQGRLSAGSIEMDPVGHKVYKKGAEVHLLPKEYALLELLMRHPGQVFSSDAILQRVWGMDSDASNDAVRTAVSRLRQKLDDAGDESTSLIEGIRKIGYRLRVSR